MWSLRGDTGEAVCISNPEKKLKLTAPGILTQARCCGGEITSVGLNQNALRSQKEFGSYGELGERELDIYDTLFIKTTFIKTTNRGECIICDSPLPIY